METLLNKLNLYFCMRGIILISNDLVSDYSFDIKKENEIISEDEIKEYDIMVTQNIIPKACIKHMHINIEFDPQ